MRKFFAVIALGFMSTTAVAHDAPMEASPSGVDEIIEFRKSVMNTAGHSARLLMHISKGSLKQDQHFAAIANQMAQGAAMMKDAFRQNTIGKKTKAKTQVKTNTAIWDNWEDYSTRLDAFAKDTAITATLASAGDIEGAKASLKAVLDHCKSCHKKYED